MFFNELIQAFEKEKIPYVVVGGYALALHGIVRATVDVDLVLRLNLKDYQAAEATLNKLGLESRIPVRAQDIIQMREEYIAKRNLLAWPFIDPKNPMRQVDLLIFKDLKEIKIEKISVGHQKIPVASLEDLKAMKKKSNRPQDKIDLQMIEQKLKDQKR